MKFLILLWKQNRSKFCYHQKSHDVHQLDLNFTPITVVYITDIDWKITSLNHHYWHSERKINHTNLFPNKFSFEVRTCIIFLFFFIFGTKFVPKKYHQSTMPNKSWITMKGQGDVCLIYQSIELKIENILIVKI